MYVALCYAPLFRWVFVWLKFNKISFDDDNDDDETNFLPKQKKNKCCSVIIVIMVKANTVNKHRVLIKSNIVINYVGLVTLINNFFFKPQPLILHILLIFYSCAITSIFFYNYKHYLSNYKHFFFFFVDSVI